MLAMPLVVGCRVGTASPVGGSDVSPSKMKLARQVTVARAEVRDLTYDIDTVGTIEAIRQTSIAPGVTGIVEEVLFQEGDQVTPASTVLIKIDQAKYTTAEDVAKATAERARARLAQVEDVFRRITSLRARNASSEQDLINAKQELEVAKAELAAAAATQKMAAIILAKSMVRPPYPGQINERRVAVGDYVKEETVIATIADLSSLRLQAFIPELAAPRLKAGDTLQFTVEALPGRKFTGRIMFLSTVADPQTHMFECKADIVKLEPEMRPGLFARVRITLEKHAGACVVPEEAVRPTEIGFVVFVPVAKSTGKDQAGWTAQSRKVALGFRRPGIVEVLDGVKAGENVVARGAEALTDGVPIEIVDANGDHK